MKLLKRRLSVPGSLVNGKWSRCNICWYLRRKNNHRASHQGDFLAGFLEDGQKLLHSCHKTCSWPSRLQFPKYDPCNIFFVTNFELDDLGQLENLRAISPLSELVYHHGEGISTRGKVGIKARSSLYTTKTPKRDEMNGNCGKWWVKLKNANLFLFLLNSISLSQWTLKKKFELYFP